MRARHLVAQPLQPVAPAGAARLAGDLDPAGRSETVADRADPGKIQRALQIPAARHDLRRRRVEPCAHADTVAGLHRIAARRDADAHPARLLVGHEAGQRVRGDDDPPAAFALIDIDHPPGQRDRAEPVVEHRRAVPPRSELDQRETGGDKREQQRDRARDRDPAQRRRDRHAGQRMPRRPTHQGGSTVSAKYAAMPAPRKTGSQWARRSPSALRASASAANRAETAARRGDNFPARDRHGPSPRQAP